MSVCSSCRLRPICSVYQIHHQFVAVMNTEVQSCRFYQASGTESVMPFPAPVPPDNGKLKQELSELFKSDEKPVVATDDEPKGVCSKCHKIVPASTLTDTFDGQTLCEECYEELPPTKL